MFTTQSQQSFRTPAADGPKPRSTVASVQPGLQALLRGLMDSGHVHKRAWQTLQRHMLEAQSEILKDCLSEVESKLRAFNQPPSPASRAAGQPEKVVIQDKVIIE